jgi:hypothetical protein
MTPKNYLSLSLLFVLLFFSQCKKDEKIEPESEPETESAATQPEENQVNLENEIASTPENKMEENSASAIENESYTEIKSNLNNKNYKKNNNIKKTQTNDDSNNELKYVSGNEPKNQNTNKTKREKQTQQTNEINAGENIELAQQNKVNELEKAKISEVDTQNEELEELTKQRELEAARLQEEEAKAIANKMRAEQEIQQKKDSLKALAEADSIKKALWNTRTRHYFGVTLNQGFVLNYNHPNLPIGFGGTLRYATTDKLFKTKKNLLTISLTGFNNPYNGGGEIAKSLFNGKNDGLSYISLMFGYRINFNDFENGLFFEPSIGPVASGGDYFGGIFTGKLGYLFNKWEVATFIDLATGSQNNNLGKKEIITTGVSAGYNFDLTKPKK